MTIETACVFRKSGNAFPDEADFGRYLWKEGHADARVAR